MTPAISDSVHLRRSSHRSLERGAPKATVDQPRVCSVAGCGTRLSRYNHSAMCGSHSGWQDQRKRHHG